MYGFTHILVTKTAIWAHKIIIYTVKYLTFLNYGSFLI